jgi:hypothetical protein
MSNERARPVTKKSRTVESLSSAIVGLVQEDGVLDPTKTAIVESVVAGMITPGAPTVFVDMLRTEMANMLETYFSEVCQAAGNELGLPFHYTSKRWYSKAAAYPESKLEAQQYIVVFGNGRTGKAAGVRFVTPDDEPDPMLLCALEKSIDVVNAAINTHTDRIHKVLSSGSVGLTDANEYRNRLPPPLSQAVLGNLQ